MPGLKLLFLGPPRIERTGEPVEIGASKGLALLVYLAVTGESHSRDALSTLLWPESDQSRGRSYLRHALWSLKQGIGDRWIQASREQISFRPDGAVWLDVQAFREGLAEASVHEHAGDRLCPDCLAQLEKATGYYSADFLSGFTLPDAPAFDEWQFFQAEELRRLLAGALERLVRAHRSRRAYDDGARAARRRLALDPLHEPAHRSLMRLYALAGRKAAALRQYEECARLLDEELGVEPDEETVALYKKIRSRQLEPPAAARPDPAGAPLLPAERYRSEELLATGAHGEVYRGRDVQTADQVIVKRLRPHAVRADKALLARLIREGEALSRLNHPNIVRMLSTFERDGQRHLVMEYMPGGSLAERLRKEPRLSLDEVLAIALELADALSRAHHLGIIHRDVKPENVLLAADGTPRLTDFGLARLTQSEARLTDTGALLGTPAYMSPELLQGAEPDFRSDVWSFGVLLFEMLAGTHPFAGEQVAAILLAIVNDPVPEIGQIRDDLPPALADLLRRLLAKEPAGRIGSMRLVAAELEAIRKAPPAGSAAAPVARPAAEAPPAPGRPEGAPFVAREQELARLEELLATALAGRPRFAFVLGEAGQGKSALLQAIARLAQERHPELIVAGGNCNAYTGVGDPFLPFREILALLTADLDAWSLTGTLPPDHARRIERLLPVTAGALVETAPDLIDTFVPLAGLLERTAAAPYTGKSWRHRLLEQANAGRVPGQPGLQQNALLDSYARLLQALARQAPLLLILDDLQWADPGSTDLLFHLGRRLSACPILIVGAYRPDEVARGEAGTPHPLAGVVNELQRLYGEILIDLGRAEGRAFIDAWLDQEPNRLPPFFRQTLFRQTGGHPLFTIELLRAMKERGDLHQDEAGRWEVQTGINWNRMPARVEGAIGERINRLAPALQEILQVASVEGETFTAEVVARVLDLDEGRVVGLLSRELDKVHALVGATGARRAGSRRLSRYRFRHILIQRYLYNLLDEVERIYRHEAVGRALEAVHGEQSAEVAVELARHFELAQLPEKAAAYHFLAGVQAQRRSALKEAIRLYQNALAYWPKGDADGRATLLRKLGECQWMTGQAREALETLAAGYERFKALGDTEAAGAMQRLIGRVYWEMGDREKSLAHYRRALSLLEALPDSVELAWAISSISQMHMLASESDEAIAWGERALALARRLEAEAVIIHALNNVGTAHLLSHRPEVGRAMLEESVLRAIAANLPHDACRGRLNLGAGLVGLDLYEEARETFLALHNYANEVHTGLYITSSLIELARLDWLTGRWRTSLQHSPQIRERLEADQSMAYTHVIAGQFFGRQLNDLGRPDEAQAALSAISGIVHSFDELQFTAPYLIEVVRALGALPREAEAGQSAHELLDLLDGADDARTLYIEALLFVLDAVSPAAVADPQMKALSTLLERFGRDGAVRQAPSRQAAWYEAMGKLALLQGEWAQATAHYRLAVDHWQAIERPYDRARALQKLGEGLRMTGEDAEALKIFTLAKRLIEKLAAQLDDGETRAAFLQSSLARAVQAGACPPQNS